MNSCILISGILALMATLGHFFVGTKAYLMPLQQSTLNAIPKGIMVCLFHYASVWLILSTIALMASGIQGIVNNELVQFIAFVYLGMALVQIVIAIKFPVKNGVIKLFQWIFWVLIGTFGLVGSIA